MFGGVLCAFGPRLSKFKKCCRGVTEYQGILVKCSLGWLKSVHAWETACAASESIAVRVLCSVAVFPVWYRHAQGMPGQRPDLAGFGSDHSDHLKIFKCSGFFNKRGGGGGGGPPPAACGRGARNGGAGWAAWGGLGAGSSAISLPSI